MRQENQELMEQVERDSEDAANLLEEGRKAQQVNEKKNVCLSTQAEKKKGWWIFYLFFF